jgi:hypothetical protein
MNTNRRTLYPLAVLLAALASGCGLREEAAPLACTICGDATFLAGESPNITVELTNQTKRDIYLVHSLYGSNWRKRYPHCYFNVTGPKSGVKPPLDRGDWCGTLDTLMEENFTKIPPGGSFKPGGGRWELEPEHFVAGGEYRFKFVYSTAGADMDKWVGSGHPDAATLGRLQRLLDQVPKTTVESNEITITCLPPKK